MISSLRNSAHLVLWVVVAAFVIGLLPAAVKQLSDTAIWAVKVNGQQIGYKEYMLEKERQKERILAFRGQYGEYADWLLQMMNMSDPQALAVRSVARQELINQLADSVGVHIGDEYVMQKMSDPAFVTQELNEIIPPQIVDSVTGIDHIMLGRYLKHIGLSTDLFERQIERQMTEKLMTNILNSSLYVPEFDIKQKYLSEHANKSFSIIQLPLDQLIAQQKKEELPEGKLQTFYDEQNNQMQRYLVPEKRSGTMWTFSPKSYDINISNARIEANYEKNKVSKYIDKPALVEVKHILFAVTDPAQRIAQQEKAARIKDELVRDHSQFNDLAARLSDDKETAATGGLLKPFTRGTHEQVFDKASFILQNDGDISDVIETSRGFEIVQRVSKKPQIFKALASVAQEIKKELQEKSFEGQFVADMRAVIDNEQSLKEFIAQKGSMAQEVQEIALDKTPLSEHLFKLEKGEKSFFVDGDKGIAIRLDGITKSYIPALESIKKAVIEDYFTVQATQELKTKLKEIKELAANKSIKEVQDTIAGSKIIRTGWLEPGKEHPKLNELGLPLEQMLQMEKIGALMTHSGPAHGFLVRLDEVEPFNADKFSQNQAETAQALRTERGQQLLEGFVASLYRNATIETNESVITLQA